MSDSKPTNGNLSRIGWPRLTPTDELDLSPTARGEAALGGNLLGPRAVLGSPPVDGEIPPPDDHDYFPHGPWDKRAVGYDYATGVTRTPGLPWHWVGNELYSVATGRRLAWGGRPWATRTRDWCDRVAGKRHPGQ